MSLLEAKNLELHYPVRGGLLGVSATGCAPSTGFLSCGQGRDRRPRGRVGLWKELFGGKVLLGLEPLRSGTLKLMAATSTSTSSSLLGNPWRRDVQMIFQDPAASSTRDSPSEKPSLNP